MKKCKVFLALAIATSLLTASTAYAATQKEVTYREQNSYEDINMVFLEPGEQIDLKFIGAPDYQSYTRTWSSSDKSVATVNSAGVITAKKPGQAHINFTMGTDKYTTKGVMVVVGTSEEIRIGADGNPFTEDKLHMMPGEVVDLDFLNFRSSNKAQLQFKWIVNNPNIVEVQTDGKVKAIATGSSKVSVEIKNIETGYIYPVIPVEIIVGGNVKPKATSTPAPTLTPVITKAPSATPTGRPSVTPTSKPTSTSTPTPTVTNTPTPAPTSTSTPTPEPTATSTPTPTPLPLTYSVGYASDKTFKIKFNRSATEVGKNDISVTQGGEPLTVSSISWQEDKTILLIEMSEYLWDNTSYTVSIKDTRTLNVNTTARFNVPDRAELSWSSLGVENKAYTQSDNLGGFQSDVKLSVKLFANDVDVTYTYAMQGYTEFEVLTDYKDYYSFTGDTLVFYDSGKSVRLKGKYSYWGSGNKNVELETDVKNITSQKPPKFALSKVEEYTVISSGSETKIDWNNPVHEVIAGSGDSYTIVALISDNFGNLYSTHENGVYGDYKGLDDYSTPYMYNIGNLMFTCRDNEKYYVGESGELNPIDTSNASVTLKYTNSDGNEKSVSGNIKIKIQPAAKLAEIRLSASNLNVSSAAMPGYESLCTDFVTFKFYDQYGKEFEYDGILDITCSDNGVNSLMSSGSGPAYISGNEIHVNGMDIRSGTSRQSVQFIVKSEDNKVSTRFTAGVLDPALDSSGNIIVSGWALDNNTTYDATITDTDTPGSPKVVPINIYDVSRSNVKVGLKTANVHITTNNNMNFTATNCTEGDLYITVVGPNGAVLKDVTTTPYATGVRLNETTGMIEIVFGIGTAENPNYITTLPAGTYTIKAVHITKNDGTRVQTARKNSTITINSKAPTFTYTGVDSNSTNMPATTTDEVKAIVCSIFNFKLNGEDIKITPDMISQITWSTWSGPLRVNGLVINVPYNGKLGTGHGYSVTINNINRSITLTR